MTAHAVSSPSVVAVASSSAAKSASQDPTTRPFEQQLHAAHQERSASVQKQPAARESHPQRGPDPGRDRRRDPSPAGPATRHADDSTNASAKLDAARSTETTLPGEAGAAATAATAAAASVPVAAVVVAAVSAPVKAVLSAVCEGTASADKSAEGEEQGAAALVSAMLAMIGPAVGKVLTPGAVPAPGAKVATDRGATALLPVMDTAAMLADPLSVSTAMPMAPTVVDSLMADFKDMHASALSDAATPPLVATSGMPASAAPTAPVSVSLASPAGTPAFTQELGHQIAWFVGHDVKQARIRLHPEELGSLDLKISVSHGRVDVSFQAQHPGAVTAVQQSLPQLGQMLAQHGLSLGNAEVGQQSQHGDRRNQAGSEGGVSETTEVHGASLVTPLSQIGLLDAFA